MTDKCRAEFEKWACNYDGELNLSTCTKPISYREYQNQEAQDLFKSFQAAYNLREQEVQRLREALEFYANNKHWYEGLECMGSNVILRECGNIAKQALQQDLTTKGD
ncbi:MAG: hypothetical protein ACRC5T_11015 [Cetobacterium sp.]